MTMPERGASKFHDTENRTTDGPVPDPPLSSVIQLTFGDAVHGQDACVVNVVDSSIAFTHGVNVTGAIEYVQAGATFPCSTIVTTCPAMSIAPVRSVVVPFASTT
jgi:hypothetical protein